MGFEAVWTGRPLEEEHAVCSPMHYRFETGFRPPIDYAVYEPIGYPDTVWFVVCLYLFSAVDCSIYFVVKHSAR